MNGRLFAIYISYQDKLDKERHLMKVLFKSKLITVALVNCSESTVVSSSIYESG